MRRGTVLFHKNSRIQLKFAIMTVEKESQVYEMQVYKNSRMELGYQYLLLRKKARSVQYIKRAEWSSDTQYLLLRV